MTNPNCSTCVHRRPVPGDAHSACANPLLLGDPSTPFVAAQSALVTGGFTTSSWTIKFNRHGVANGWAFFPFNFDPVWLIECTQHQPKEQTDGV